MILQIKTSATKDDIKAAFRKLAKVHHPDLNRNIEKQKAEEKMMEIVEAYDQLMNDDFGSKVGDSRVALACEVYTIEELKLDRSYNVYPIQIIYDNDESQKVPSLQSRNVTDSNQSKMMTTTTFIQVEAHPDDSVSDLKRRIQSLHSHQWGIGNRKLDRDQVATGWELVTAKDNQILSYHLFLHTYGIMNNDILYAVVRKY